MELVGKSSSIDSVRKSGHIVQPLGCCCLAPQRGSLDNQSIDSLTGSVERGSQSSWPPTDNNEIVMTALGSRLELQFGCQLSVGWFNQDRTVGELDSGDDALAVVLLENLLLSGFVLFDINTVVRNMILAQELLSAPAVGTPMGAIDRDVGCFAHCASLLVCLCLHCADHSQRYRFIALIFRGAAFLPHSPKQRCISIPSGLTDGVDVLHRYLRAGTCETECDPPVGI